MKWVNHQETAVILEAVDIKESVEFVNDDFLDVFGHKRHKFSPQVLCEWHFCIEVLQLEVLLILKHLRNYGFHFEVKSDDVFKRIDPFENPNNKFRSVEFLQQNIHLGSVIFSFATPSFSSDFKLHSHWGTVREIGS